MSVVRGKKNRNNPFVQLSRKMFEDEKISLKAKGLIGYCLSKPDDWVFYISNMANELKEGEKAIYSALDELIENGYAFRYQKRKENGEFDYWETIVSDSVEEIKICIEELESPEEIKKSFTEPQNGDVAHKAYEPDRRFGRAGFGGAALYINNNNKTKNDISSSSIASSSLETSSTKKRSDDDDFEKMPLGLEDSEPVTFKNTKGKLQSVSQSEIYRYFIQKRTSFDTSTIKQAIRRAKELEAPITDIMRFLETTCENIESSNKKNKILSNEPKPDNAPPKSTAKGVKLDLSQIKL